MSRRQLGRSLAAGASASLFQAVPSRAQASVLRVRQGSDLQQLDPAYRATSSENNVMRCLYRTLVRYKPGDAWVYENDAAQSIEQTDPTHVRFTLKPGIIWSNGIGEMTAEDVKFTFERHVDPKTASPYRNDWEVLDRVDITDKYSGVIVLKEPFTPLWRSTLPWGSGYILNRKQVELAGGRIRTDPKTSCGPYVLSQFTPGQKAVLTRNPDYQDFRPEFDEVQVFAIPEAKTAEIAFEAGELDYTEVSVASLVRYRKQLPRGATLFEKPSLAWVWLGMNGDNPTLKDIRLRQAIQKAVDVDGALDAAYFGVAKRATGIIAPGLVGHRDITMPGRDLAGAKKLLAEAGLSRGVKLTLHLLNNSTMQSLAQVIQASLLEIGVEVELVPVAPAVYWTLGNESKGDAWKSLQLILTRYTSSPDPSQMTAWYTPQQVGVWNWERFSSSEFGALHKAGLVEADDAKRRPLYVRMQEMMEQSGQYVFLTHEVFGVLHNQAIAPAVMPDATPIYSRFRRA